ncbi:hypothetical protein NH26_20480 [Flammeovirga pacifica]|uniref:Secretion system C-terminal sorting domain-containing protein n=2 Tax=Flammeovirga pacifica TaxID=915059 RepID=A0A1S1YSJ1_FLAPC|nr:hypothetical protein NH26_20480 [Flammeovirga pacifica]
MLCTGIVNAQNNLNRFDTDILSSSNYIIGTPYEVHESGQLNVIKMKCNATGVNVQFAIYSDDGNAPDQLITTSEVMKMNATEMIIPLEEGTVLEKGNYWIMANYEKGGKHLKGDVSNDASEVYYFANQFGGEFPSNAYAFDKYLGHSFPIALELSEIEPLFKVEVFPNPTTTNVNVSTSKEGFHIDLIDHLGRIVGTYDTSTKEVDIDMSQRSKGRYFIKVNNQLTYQIIKE